MLPEMMQPSNEEVTIQFAPAIFGGSNFDVIHDQKLLPVTFFYPLL